MSRPRDRILVGGINNQRDSDKDRLVRNKKTRRAHKADGVFFREERGYGNEASVMFPSFRYS